MHDFREEFLLNTTTALLSQFSPEDVRAIGNILLLQLDKYEIQERCTDVALVENSSEQLIKLYAGCILTEGKSRKTVDAYVRFLKRFYYEINKPLTEVDVFDIRVWFAKAQQKISLRTCENYRAYLSAFYTWLMNEELIDKNPMSKIKPIKYKESIKKPFSDVELDLLRCSCTTLRERAELELLISSGARVSELCAMTIDDVDLQSLEVIIREGKGGKSRKSYITSVCASYIKKYLSTRDDDSPYLFVSKFNDKLSKSSIRNDMNRIGELAGVKNVHPHRCRRSFASTLARKGMDVRTIQTLMGHTDINTTMTYVYIPSDHIGNEYRKYN